MISVSEKEGQKVPARHCMVVAGMHRSGTSAMARMLSLLGATLPKGLMRAQTDNPVGFLESEKIADLNDEILDALDSEWDDVFAFLPRPYLANFDRAFGDRAVELLNEEFNGAELIALKDPRVSVLTAFWERALRQGGYASNYVIMVRNPLDVAESLRTRNNFSRDKCLLLWSGYMTAVERDTRALPRTFVLYDDLIRDWRRVRDRIQDRTGVPFPRDTASAANEIDRFLDRHLRHYSTAAEDLYSRPEVPQYVKTLYRLFADACADAPFDESSVDEVQTELAKIELSVGALVADLRVRARSLETDVNEARGAQTAADARAEELAQELSEQLAQRKADAAAAALVSEEQERRLTDLMGRLSAAQAAIEQEEAAKRQAQEELAQALHQKANSESLLQKRIAALSEELQDRDAAVAQAQAKLAEQAALQAQLNQRITALSDELRQKDAAVADAKRALEMSQVESQSAEAQFHQRITALSEELRQKDVALGDATRAFERSAAEQRSAEARLEERFRELASVTTMLAESQAGAQEAHGEAEWVREVGSILLGDSTGGKGRLLALLPASMVSRRQRKLLRQRGLFDDDEYLSANPDVAAAGADPLGHYLKYGMAENRRRR